MFTYIELSSSPVEETCVQLDTRTDYFPAMKAECNRFRQMLTDIYVNHPMGEFVVKTHNHDFGAYCEVAWRCMEDDTDSVSFGYWVQNNLPRYWDDVQHRDWSAYKENIATLRKDIDGLMIRFKQIFESDTDEKICVWRVQDYGDEIGLKSKFCKICMENNPLIKGECVICQLKDMEVCNA